MTILTAGTCGFIANSAGHILPAAVGTAAGTIITGAKLWFQSEPVSVALSTAVGTGCSSGAIAGAMSTKIAFFSTASKAALYSAVTGAAVGGMAAGATGSVLAGSLALGSSLVTSNPVGLLTVGTSLNTEETQAPSFDCWKAVVHDDSVEASKGMALKDLVKHPHIADVTVTQDMFAPQIVIENVWNELFEIQYVILKDSDRLFCHANPL